MEHEELIKTDDVQVRIMVLAADESIDWHSHSAVTDNIFCLEGSIQIELRNPDQLQILQPGERYEIKPGSVHRVTNLKPGPNRYLLIQGVGSYDFNKA